MEEYKVKFLDSDGDVENKPFYHRLEKSATVSCLKKAVEKEASCPSSDFRLFFRKENGQNIGLEDDDVLKDVVDDSGQLLVECPPLGGQKQIWIHKDFSEEVCVLLGSTKSFEHHKVPFPERMMQLPSKGEIKTSFYIFIRK